MGCKAEPRSGKSRLGKACLAAARKAKRAVGAVSDTSESDTGVSESDKSDTRSDTKSDMAREIEALRAEVARLKRELATRGKVTGLGAEVNALLARPPKANGHPLFCQGVCCRASG